MDTSRIIVPPRGVALQLLFARTAVSGFAAVLAAVVALVSGPLLRRSAGSAHPG